MQDPGAFENLRSRQGDLMITHRELGNPMPTVQPLTLEEILKVEKSRLGLRNTVHNRLQQELLNGADGDYVVISNIDSFLHLKDRKSIPTKELETLLVRSALDHDRIDLLEGVGQLPENYNQSLVKFFKEALIMQMNSIFHEGNQNMSLNAYLTNYVEQLSPAWELIQGDERGYSYDIDKYYGFGKHGSNIIPPKDIVGHCLLTAEDVNELRKRYKNYLHLPVSSYVQVGNKRMHLGDFPDDDIIQLTQQKVLAMIRRKIA